MLKEVIGTGATVEAATEDAKLKLGIKEDEDFTIDVISMPKKKVMGLFGGSDAEVKVAVERPDEKPAKKNQKEKKPQKEKKEPKKEAKKEPKREEIATVGADELPADSKALKAVNYLKTILVHLGCENTEFRVAERDGGVLIVLNGEDLGVVIGRRGETLDALQHLASLAARDNDGYYKVTLNIGDYRERREDALTSLASRIAKDVLKNGRGKALEPMNPYERRIIHTAVQDIEGVTSTSVGEGENRRVVILIEGEDVSTVRIGRPRSDRNRDRGRGRYGRRDSRPSNRVTSAPTRAPRSDADLPLYGKIEKKTEE